MCDRLVAESAFLPGRKLGLKQGGERMKILITGAGIGGTALALALE